MILNKMGMIAWDCWMELPAHFTGMQLGEFVVLPNHVHGIIIIKNNPSNWDAAAPIDSSPDNNI